MIVQPLSYWWSVIWAAPYYLYVVPMRMCHCAAARLLNLYLPKPAVTQAGSMPANVAYFGGYELGKAIVPSK